MELSPPDREKIRSALLTQRGELSRRMAEIHDHARDPLDRDSEEQASQIGNLEVVAALEAEAAAEITAIDAALERLDAGRYGQCVTCGEAIDARRLSARPASAECVDCAEIRRT